MQCRAVGSELYLFRKYVQLSLCQFFVTLNYMVTLRCIHILQCHLVKLECARTVADFPEVKSDCCGSGSCVVRNYEIFLRTEMHRAHLFPVLGIAVLWWEHHCVLKQRFCSESHPHKSNHPLPDLANCWDRKYGTP